MSTDYDVRAHLELDAKTAAGDMKAAAKAARQLAKDIGRVHKHEASELAKKTRQIARETRKAEQAAKRAAAAYAQMARNVGDLGGKLRGGGGGMGGGMIGQLLGFGAAYVGLNAVVGTFKSLTAGAIEYTGWLEKTKIGLTSVIQAVEGTDWKSAEAQAGAAFKEIQNLALASPATSGEMFEIFSGIYGPIRAAGFEMQKVLDITNDSVLAASALNVDYEQAARDINMMARGTAGMEVKLFSMLRSTGAIKEDAQAWNALLPQDRVNKLSVALKKFAASGEKFGRSWVGVTSSFKDIAQNLSVKAFAPIVATLGKNLYAFNNYLLQNRGAIEAYLERFGERAAGALERVFLAGQRGFRYIVNHWDEIVARMRTIVAQAKAMAPVIAKAAAAYALVSTGKTVAGVGLQAAGGVLSAASFMGAGGGGAGAAGAGAAAGGTSVAGAIAGLAALGPVLLGIAAAATVAVAVGLAVQDHWRAMVDIFGGPVLQVGEMLVSTGKAIWAALGPVLKTLGRIILTYVAPAWLLMTTLFRGLLFAIEVLYTGIGWLTSTIFDSLKPAFDVVFQLFADLSKFITEVFGEARRALKGTPTVGSQDMRRADPEWSPINDAYDQAQLLSVRRQMNAKPAQTMQVNNDFRGSRISIKQDFKGDADPDRIVVAMMGDLTRQAESRISSGYAGALTR